MEQKKKWWGEPPRSQLLNTDEYALANCRCNRLADKLSDYMNIRVTHQPANIMKALTISGLLESRVAIGLG